MNQIVIFQGLGQRNWSELFRIPAIEEAIRRGQGILSAHDIRVENKPLDLIKACQERSLPLEYHSQTCWEQPCIYLASMAYWKMWRQKHPKDRVVLLGFSFGEWTAATAAGFLIEEEGLLVSAMRGIYTSEAGGSSLVISAKGNRLPIKRLRFSCKRVGNVWLANINSSVQGLISGQEDQLPEMQKVLADHYPQLFVRPYSVGGAFHTPRMKKARRQLWLWMREYGIRFRKPHTGLLLNATREITDDPHKSERMLLRQLSARLNFKKLAEEAISPDASITELCLGNSIVVPFIERTHKIQYQETRLIASPFPA